MANVSAPNGFIPYSVGGGMACPTYAQRAVQIAFNYGTKIFRGDPVLEVTAGTIQQWTNGSDVAQFGGVFWGCEYISTIRGYTVSPFWPAAGDVASGQFVRAYVYGGQDTPPMWYLVQTDSTGAAQADVFGNVDVTLGSGNATTGQSTAFVPMPVAVTATLPFRIMKLYSEGFGVNAPGFASGGIDNGSAAGAFNKVYVAANVGRIAGLA